MRRVPALMHKQFVTVRVINRQSHHKGPRPKPQAAVILAARGLDRAAVIKGRPAGINLSRCLFGGVAASNWTKHSSDLRKKTSTLAGKETETERRSLR